VKSSVGSTGEDLDTLQQIAGLSRPDNEGRAES
jgi:hypothetical protein